VHIEAWSGKGVVRNFGDPSTTSVDPFPVYFNRTIAVHPDPIWDFAHFQPDAVVINLGTNDYSTYVSRRQSLIRKASAWYNVRYAPIYWQLVCCSAAAVAMHSNPTPPQSVFVQGYQSLIAQVRSAYGSKMPIFLACGPMIGNPCCQYVQQVVQSSSNTHYIDLTKLNLQPSDYGCAGHPSVSGQKKMAVAAEPVIASVLGW
jgi:hypothetical protein